MSRYYCDNYIKLNSIVDTESILLSLVGDLSKLSLIPISLSSGSRNQTRDGSRDGKTSLLSSIDKSDLGELMLVPLGFRSGSRNQTRDGSGDGKTSLLSSVDESDLGELLLVPLGLSGGSRDEARGAGHRKTPLLYPVPLNLLVEVAL